MAKIRVGVKRMQHGMEVDEVGADGIEIFQTWVEIDGVRTDPEAGLLGASYSIEHTTAITDAAGNVLRDEHGKVVLDERDNLMGQVTIRFACSGFETVDHRELPDIVHLAVCGSIHPKELDWHCQCRKDPGHDGTHRCYGCGFEWELGDLHALMPAEINAARSTAIGHLNEADGA